MSLFLGVVTREKKPKTVTHAQEAVFLAFDCPTTCYSAKSIVRLMEVRLIECRLYTHFECFMQSTHTETLQESMTALEAANVDLGIFKGRATQLEGELRSARLQLAQCRGALEEAREEIRLIEAERQGAISRMEVAETKCNHAISFKKLAWENLAQEQRSNLKVLAQRDEALENLRRVQALLEKVGLC
jgi:hypothetical protein